MTKKSYLFMIPPLLLPYLALFVLSTIFFSTRVSFFGYIVESIFDSNGLLLIAVFTLCCVGTALLSLLCFAISIYKRWDALSLAKAVMTVKLLQIPAYLLIFALGVLFALGILTIPFSIGLFLFDCLSLFSTSITAISAAVNSVKQGIFKYDDVLLIIILQFFFCADVVSSVILYVKLKKAGSSASTESAETDIAVA